MLQPVLVSAVLALAASVASAGPCVKIRNGADGYTCMKFSEAERKDAARLGLRLGSTYASVGPICRATVGASIRSGWKTSMPMPGAACLCAAKDGMPLAAFK